MVNKNSGQYTAKKKGTANVTADADEVRIPVSVTIN